MNHVKDISEGKYNFDEWLMSMRITDAQWRAIYQSPPVRRSHIQNATREAGEGLCAMPSGMVGADTNTRSDMGREAV